MKISKTYQFFFLFVLIFQADILFAKNFNSPQVQKSIRIIENKGQWESQVLFKTTINSGSIFITKNGIAYALYDEHALHEKDHDRKEVTTVNCHNLFVELLNANPNPSVVKEKQSPEYYNYFIGSDPSKWKSNCYAYEKVTLKNIYNFIDLEYIAQESSFKINFIVHPKGNPSMIKWKYTGANSLDLYLGALNISTSIGIIKEEKPVCFQGGISFNSDFVLTGNTLSYFITEYNKNIDLIIDPTVIFGTYSGSYSDNWGFTGTYDNSGNGISGGTVYGNAFPVTSGAYQVIYKNGITIGGEDIARDCGILKYTPDGSGLVFCTYLGGSKNEQPHSMICDSGNNVIILGTTTSINFPTSSTAYDKTQNGSYDIFITKLSPDGTTLIGSTYFGGAKDDGINSDSTHEFFDAVARPLTYNYCDMFRGEVLIDGSGDIFVASTTMSNNNDGFPILNGFQTNYGGGTQDACVFKLSADLSTLNFSTYLGGNASDAAYGINLDYSGNIFVCGGTASNNLPSSGGSQFVYHGGTDGFIAKIYPNGNSLMAFDYIGTSVYDQVYFVQLDNQQNIYITGQSNGAMPVSAGVYKNTGGKQFVMVLDRNLTMIKISTVFGTGRTYPDISPAAFLVDVCGRVYISGWGGRVNQSYNIYTEDTYGLPVTVNAVQNTTDGSDFYLIIFSKDLKSLAYATFYGGNQSQEHVDGGTSRFDKNGTVYQSVCAGCRGYSDFPTTFNAWSRINHSSNCNNALFKIQLNVSEFAPKFNDTLIKITATDLLTLPFTMTDQDGDSIFYTFNGNIFSYFSNPASIIKKIGAGKSTGILSWQTLCKDASADTIFVTLNMIDNGCPVNRTGTGTIKILVQPPPPIPSPFPQCLKTINDDIVKLDWQISPFSKYFKDYKIYRRTNDSSFRLVKDLPNFTFNSFTDTTAFSHLINNYCYFITAVNICDSVVDTSRVICSMYRNDTAISPAFSFTKDTIIKVYAFDTITYTNYIYAIDSKDSVYIQWVGNVFGSSKLLSFQTQNGLSKAMIKFSWSSPCDGINIIDTPTILFYVKDNQCPQPRTNNGRIRIVTLPPPLNAPPDLSCIKFIDANSLEIKWKTTPVNKFFSKFILLRKTPDGKINPFISVANGNAFTATDSNAKGNLTNNFCYAVTSQDVCGFYGDTGIFKCSIRQPSDYPPFIYFSTVTVQDDKNIGVYWEPSRENNFQNYILNRHELNNFKSNSQVFSSAKINDTGFVDINVDVHKKSYCYVISQVNECGLQSQKNQEACSMLLKGNAQPFENSIWWNGYNYWSMGVNNYEIQRIQPAQNSELIAQNQEKDTIAYDGNLNYENGDYFYYVVAHEGLKGRRNVSTSNKVELIQPPLLHVPNAFSPNGDNINDMWRVVPVFVKTFQLKIYDRWGKMVFESDDKHTLFNGLIDGNVQVTGDVFVYLITYTGWDDVVHSEKGNLTILK